MLHYVATCLWFALPAYVGNMAPVFAKKLCKDRFATPVDLSRRVRGRRLSGSNKTYRGIVAAIVFSLAMVTVQRALYGNSGVQSISLVDYHNINWLVFGVLMGLGAMLGDLAKSMAKRQLDKHPGESWRPFDQVDFLIGAVLLTSVVYLPPAHVVAGILVIVPLVKVTVDHVGVYLHLYDSKW